MTSETNKIWTLSNSLSISRIFLIAPVIYCYLAEFSYHSEIAILLIFVGMGTDILDGYLARRRHEVSEIGKFIDPVCDKIAVTVFGTVVTIVGDVPIWFMLAIVARDLLILIGGFMLKRKRGIIVMSNVLGKITAIIVSLTIILAILHYDSLQAVVEILLWISTVMLILSFAVYTQRFFHYWNSPC